MHNHHKGGRRVANYKPPHPIVRAITSAWREVEDFLLYVRRYRKPRIVAVPGWLGGRPRLAGTRLGVNWFAANRNEDPAFFKEHWGYIPQEHWDFMFAVVDAVLDPDAEEPWRAES